MKGYAFAIAAGILGLALTGCTGRRADTMVPTRETVEVVIPEGDVRADSAIAAGDTGEDTVVSRSGIEVL